MLPLRLSLQSKHSLSVLALGAHPDDIEIGAGATLLTLAESQLQVHAWYVVLTGTAERHLEARAAATAFLPDADLTVDFHRLPEGRLPVVWGRVKEILEELAQTWNPDLILAPSPNDAHQDHRVIGEIVPTVFRNHLSLSYEIPKFDGDLGRPSLYVPFDSDVAHRKVELLHKCFPSQASRDWWDDEVFLGLARIRGMECRAPYAEAFTSTKAVVQLVSAPMQGSMAERGTGEHLGGAERVPT
jgi:LmbE family N-acetylglucosaminyl deacetylase